MDLDDFAKNYLSLGLRINKYIDGYVEHYYGPPEIKRKVDLEDKLSPKDLLKDYYNLYKQLEKQTFETKRLKFFDKTFIAIETILRKLNGDKILYLEQVEKFFDFIPKLYDDEFFYELSLKADKAYKGEGNLSQRIENYVKKRKIPKKQLKALFIKALYIAKEKTIKKFPNLLPENENIEVKRVKGQSWAMYNWYLGNFSSRIDINVEKFYYWTSLLPFACHEGYPGHHTARCVKDNLLYRNKGYFENCISLIYTPEFVIYEGMGTIAEDVIFDVEEITRILLELFCSNPDDEDTLETLIQQCEIRRGFRRFNHNVAYHKHINGWEEEDLIAYCNEFKVPSKSNIESILKFISDDIWAPYALAYQGERIIKERFGDPPPPKHFSKLITGQYLPSDLI